MPREMDNALRSEVAGTMYDIGPDNWMPDDGDDAIDEAECGVWVKVLVWIPDHEPLCEPHTESPESTERYECPFCGNREHFTGHDDHGYPGDACECAASDEDAPDDAECTCEETLSQDFSVEYHKETGTWGDPEYAAHIGGGCGAEIGSYDRIDCNVCYREIWRGPEADASVEVA